MKDRNPNTPPNITDEQYEELYKNFAKMVQRAVFSDNKKIMQSIGTSIWGTLQPLPPLKLIPCRGFNPDTSDSDVIYKIDTDISNSYIENVSIHVERALETLLKGSDIYSNKNFKNYTRIQEKYSEVLEY